MTTTLRLAPETQAVWRAIADHFDRHDLAPSMRELMDACGYRSTSAVFYQLDHLEAAGVISRVAKKPRTLVLNCRPPSLRALTPPEADLNERPAAWQGAAYLLRWRRVNGHFVGFYVYTRADEQLIATVGDVS